MMNSKVMMMTALAICGCSRMSEGVPAVEQEMVELSFNIPCQETTRASGSVSEEAVEDLQVYVFGLDGLLQAYGHSEGSELTLTCSTGDKRIAAIVNAPLRNNVVDEAGLMKLVSSFSENSLGRFVMSGITDKTVSKAERVVLPVSRLVSKVILKSVKNDFEMQQHKAMDFVVKSVFLTNAAKDRKYMTSSAPSGWYNDEYSDMQAVIAEAGNMMYESLGDRKVSDGATYEAGNFLYCYPNPLTGGASPTCLVVEASLGQTVYYYPVELPAMEANKCYSVSLTVCRPGSSSPDIPVEKVDAVFEVEVQPWSENISVDEII